MRPMTRKELDRHADETRVRMLKRTRAKLEGKKTLSPKEQTELDKCRRLLAGYKE